MPSEAGVAQLPAGFFQDREIGSGPLSACAQLPPPVSGSSHAFHQLNQVTTEIPESTASAEVVGGMGNEARHHIGGEDLSGWFAEDKVVHRCPAQGVGIGCSSHHGAITVRECLQTVFG